MTLNVQIIVERATFNPQKPFVVLFDRVVLADDSLSVPYDSLRCSLLFIFGSDAIVSFRLIPILSQH